MREQLVLTNLNHATNGGRGRLTRWQGPIQVNTNGIERAEIAVRRFEEWSGGLIRFARVASQPANGLIFVEGGARSADGSSGCAHVTDAPPGTDSTTFVVTVDGSGAMAGDYTIHLGADDCDDTREGRYESAFAEHVLAHAVGIFDHFVGYTGPEGMADAHAFAVVFNLYANPIGATAQDLVVFPPALR